MVVGAGVVGLAIARALALNGHEVLVLEAEKAFGTHTSSRNSEVVHAGIYYPADSLKARLCVAGKSLLYDYCRQRRVDFQRPGKLIVATSSGQVDMLKSYQAWAEANGVDDIAFVSKARLNQLEPDVSGVAALLSPSTGIVDSHGLMLSLLGDLENAGGTLVLNSRVHRFRHTEDGFDIEVEGVSSVLQSRVLINSAGHGAISLAKTSTSHAVPQSFYPAGHYYGYGGKSPFSHLVYPVASRDSLGIHATLDLGGQLKFGPDVDWRNQLDYTFADDETRLRHFESAIRAYFPALEVERLQPGYVGVRPRISAPGKPLADFEIQYSDKHGMSGLAQLFGIESPGLTACLAIGDEIVSHLA